jgi:hypothetical protein
MRWVLSKLKTKFRSLVAGDLHSLKFLLGQAAILSSRANSKEFKNLWDAEVKIYSQWGEDGILDYLCERLEISKPKVVEIGAGNFSECNSRFLAENRNASVFAVDVNAELLTSIKNNPLYWTNHIFAHEVWVSPENINQIMELARDSIGTIDVFSLDLDGNDYWVLSEANLESVSIVVVEYNPLFGHINAVTVPRNDQFERSTQHYSFLYWGASIKAFTHALTKKNFRFCGTNRVGNNAFFVRDDLFSKVHLEPNPDWAIYTDWRIRESRSKTGNLNYISGFMRVEEIAELELVDVESKAVIQVKEANPSL